MKNNKKSQLDNLFDQFVKQCRIEGKSRITIKNYKSNFELLKKFKPDLQIKDLTTKTMINFLDFLQNRERKVGNEMIVRDLKNNSLGTIRSKLNVFFKWLIDNEYLDEDNNPFNDIKYPNVEYTDKIAFTKDELDKIYLSVNRDIKWENILLRKRNIAMIMLLLLTGIRKGEFLGLKIADIDLKNKTLTVRGETSKSKRTRIIPIKAELIPFLEDYYLAREDYASEWLWVGNNKDDKFTEHGLKHLVIKLKKETGIKKFHIHRFRHTFAVNYYRQTHDLVGLNKLLGHKSFRMTLSYLRSLPDDDTVQQMERMNIANFR